jgi:hypothetical protein
MWMQVVGKSMLACCAPQNHWWHSALRVTARGLATPAPLAEGARAVDVEFDLIDQFVAVRCDGRSISMRLEPRSVRSFYEEYMTVLRALGIEVRVWTTPVEIPDPVPFDRDERVRDYDPAAARRFGEVLRKCDVALKGLAQEYVGKQSPVHFFWGSFDLAYTRFSGRRAPERPGADAVTREAYSHEVISFGFWPGGVTPSGVEVAEPVFYAYAAPEPEGFRDAPLRVSEARYDASLGEYILPYEDVGTSTDPTSEIRAFCEDIYVAGATLGGWDRASLERESSARWQPAAADSHPVP